MQRYGVVLEQLTFFETDEWGNRTSNIFNITKETDTTFSGLSCWISFRVTVSDPNQINYNCMAAEFVNFNLP